MALVYLLVIKVIVCTKPDHHAKTVLLVHCTAPDSALPSPPELTMKSVCVCVCVDVEGELHESTVDYHCTFINLCEQCMHFALYLQR